MMLSKYGFDDQLGILARQFRDARDLFDEVGFRHGAFFYVLSPAMFAMEWQPSS